MNIPLLGFGTWRLAGEMAYQSVRSALEVGYRHIDTADMYGNHREVGRAIGDSGLAREEMFITSKVWLDHLSQEEALKTIQRTLQELQLDYVDLFLIHWPNPSVPISETIESMLLMKERGWIKDFGVSNFTIELLRQALNVSHEVANNQVEFHPSLNQQELFQFCQQHDVCLTAYSPIGRGEDFQLKEVQQVAMQLEVSASQVILAWLRQKGIVAIPRSSKREHIIDNFASLELILKEEDFALIDSLNTDNRMINPDFGPF